MSLNVILRHFICPVHSCCCIKICPFSYVNNVYSLLRIIQNTCQFKMKVITATDLITNVSHKMLLQISRWVYVAMAAVLYNASYLIFLNPEYKRK